VEINSSKFPKHWYSIGLTIALEIPEQPQTAPHERRRVAVFGKVHIKDFKLVGHDLLGQFDFDAVAIVDPTAPQGEVFLQWDRLVMSERICYCG
jgi:hypothetical protein